MATYVESQALVEGVVEAEVKVSEVEDEGAQGGDFEYVTTNITHLFDPVLKLVPLAACKVNWDCSHGQVCRLD